MQICSGLATQIGVGVLRCTRTNHAIAFDPCSDVLQRERLDPKARPESRVARGRGWTTRVENEGAVHEQNLVRDHRIVLAKPGDKQELKVAAGLPILIRQDT